ncbi:hypothetical protein E8E14_005110 [Neopestalotiopsis sp. 37M]|nr:hypothetical protein E8E14_005110 [Neopestalotiopsis sp. 37M]
MRLRIEKASLLQQNNYFHEALSLILEVRNSEEAYINPYESSYAGVILVGILQAMGDHDWAIRASYELVDFLIAAPASEAQAKYSSMLFMETRHGTLLMILGKLERSLRDCGRLEEAEAVQRRLEEGAHL